MEQWADCPLQVASLVFFDLETTGLRPDRGARIREIAVLGHDGIRFDWTWTEAERNASDAHDTAVGDVHATSCGRSTSTAGSRKRRRLSATTGGATS